jgi:hypothetical protein
MQVLQCFWSATTQKKLQNCSFYLVGFLSVTMTIIAAHMLTQSNEDMTNVAKDASGQMHTIPREGSTCTHLVTANKTSSDNSVYLITHPHTHCRHHFWSYCLVLYSTTSQWIASSPSTKIPQWKQRDWARASLTNTYGIRQHFARIFRLESTHFSPHSSIKCVTNTLPNQRNWSRNATKCEDLIEQHL